MSFQYIPRERHGKHFWEIAHQKCEDQGGQLASFKTPSDVQSLRYLYERNAQTPFAFIGLTRNRTVTGMYRYGVYTLSVVGKGMA